MRDMTTRNDSADHRAAEELHRKRRTDRDRIIAAALRCLEDRAADMSVGGLSMAPYYIAGSAGVQAPDLGNYVTELVKEIRQQMSPLVDAVHAAHQ